MPPRPDLSVTLTTPRPIRPRPWSTLPSSVQLQLAQQMARVCRRVRQEARRAERER